MSNAGALIRVQSVAIKIFHLPDGVFVSMILCDVVLLEIGLFLYELVPFYL